MVIILKMEDKSLKKVLEDHNIDMTRFDYVGQNNSCRLRRKKIRLSDDISMPCEPTNSEVTKDSKLKIASGVYKMGEEIVPQNFKSVNIKWKTCDFGNSCLWKKATIKRYT